MSAEPPPPPSPPSQPHSTVPGGAGSGLLEEEIPPIAESARFDGSESATTTEVAEHVVPADPSVALSAAAEAVEAADEASEMEAYGVDAIEADAAGGGGEEPPQPPSEISPPPHVQGQQRQPLSPRSQPPGSDEQLSGHQSDDPKVGMQELEGGSENVSVELEEQQPVTGRDGVVALEDEDNVDEEVQDASEEVQDYASGDHEQDQRPQAEEMDLEEEPEVEDDQVPSRSSEEKDEEGVEETPMEEEELAEAEQAQETNYSTRGRVGDAMDPLERLAREALGESTAPKEKERESFLSDAITEEERRTRTRYIPSVEGMHQLRKHEMKSDLALARNVGGGTSVKPKVRRGNSMDIDGEEVTSIDEDRSDIQRLGTTKGVEIGYRSVIIPSTAFLPPPASLNEGKQSTTPREVEAVTAFNPPRPPESVGPKKKHRMLRWERRPADIEVDLSNYRKTVHRTRDELRRAEEERERLESVDNQLRRHFLLHMDAMSQEWKRLNKELAAVQQECVNSADLLTSRTRSRGAGKSSYAMRDVLTVLRSRGQEMEAKGLTVPINPAEGDSTRSGLGGVHSSAFQDWDRETEIVPTAIASCWILPGDSVATPYGDGQVVAVLGSCPVDVNLEPHKDLTFKRRDDAPMDTMEVDSARESIKKGLDVRSASQTGKSVNNQQSKAGKDDDAGAVSSGPGNSAFVAPRIAVRLPFGVGFFPAWVVTPKEDPTAYSDTRIALRWKGIIETSVEMGGFLDAAAMAEPADSYRETVGLNAEEEGADKDDDMGKEQIRLLPFGSRMLPTSNGRGACLWNMTLDSLDRAIDRTLIRGGPVLADKDNPAVPFEIGKREEENQAEISLRAQVLHLRNELYRQRRVRMLNERTFASTQERAARVEALVAEMRTDLKTLKRRLDEEVAELGISENEAEAIVTTYYQSLDSQHSGDASPPKRSRRMSRLETEDEDIDDEDEAEQTDAVSMELSAAQ